METKELAKEQWQSVLDVLSSELAGVEVEIDVAGTNLGSQVEASQLPLQGLTYDPRSDAVEIWAGTLIEHNIESPKSIRLAMEDGALSTVSIVDKDEQLHLIKLSSPREVNL